MMQITPQSLATNRFSAQNQPKKQRSGSRYDNLKPMLFWKAWRPACSRFSSVRGRLLITRMSRDDKQFMHLLPVL